MCGWQQKPHLGGVDIHGQHQEDRQQPLLMGQSASRAELRPPDEVAALITEQMAIY